jgi:hypothetical protein
MFAGTERHDVQPPVLATAKLPITGAVGEPNRTSTKPLTPPDAPEATRPTNWSAAVPVPKSRPENFNQSPLPNPVTDDEPIVAPLASEASSASITRYAEPDGSPDGDDDGVGVGVGVGEAVGLGTTPPGRPKVRLSIATKSAG